MNFRHKYNRFIHFIDEADLLLDGRYLIQYPKPITNNNPPHQISGCSSLNDNCCAGG